MNRKITVASLMLVLLCTTYACFDLDVEPREEALTETYFQTGEDVQAALISAYGHLNVPDNYYARKFYILTDVASDDSEPGNSISSVQALRRLIDQFQHTSVHEKVETVYARIFEAIKNANIVIRYAPEVDMDEQERNEALGQARFLRALNYFNAVRLWGNLPLLDSPVDDIDSEANLSRADAALIYDLIIEDLTFAENNLPGAWPDAFGRATRWSAKSLLASVYLTLERWAEARDKADEVITQSRHALVPDYFTVYDLNAQNNSEMIFSIRNLGAVEALSGRWVIHCLPDGTADGFGVHIPEMRLVERFPDTYRKSVSILYQYRDPRTRVLYDTTETGWAGRPIIGKWVLAFSRSKQTDAKKSDMDYPVLRFSEVLLTYAEAANKANGGPTPLAVERLNLVKRRARGELLTPAQQTSLRIDLVKAAQELPDATLAMTEEAFDDNVMNERWFELCFEQKRWFDLIRKERLWNEFKAAKGAQDYYKLYPIPQREILLTGFNQNQGY